LDASKSTLTGIVYGGITGLVTGNDGVTKRCGAGHHSGTDGTFKVVGATITIADCVFADATTAGDDLGESEGEE